MINDFIEQCQFDEDRGLLPRGYTEGMKNQLSKSEQGELIAGENKYNLNGGEL